MKIGIDLGGTKMAGIILDTRGNVVHRLRQDTPRGDYRIILTALTDFIRQLLDDCGGEANIGLGTPGSMGTDGRVRNSNTTELNGRPLKADLEAALQQPVNMSNDANCFTLSEATDGAAADFDNVFGVIIGTGTGGGMVINGQLIVGSNHIGGEWGHNPLPWMTPDEQPGALCYCGKRGCIETFLSGPALEARYQVLSGQGATAREIANLAEHGNRQAEQVLQIYEDQLARALASVINLLDPHCIVLGGGLSNIQRLYQQVPQRWGKYIFSDTVNTRLVPPRYGDDSGVRGAAWLADPP